MIVLLLMLALAEPAEANAPSTATQPTTAPATQPVMPARVVSVAGIVQRRVGQDENWKPIAVGDVLQENSEIRTGVRSQVVLKLANGAEVTLDRLGVIMLSSRDFQDGRFGPAPGIKYGRTRFDIHPATSPATQSAMPATTTAVEGNAQFRAAPQDVWRVLEPGTTLPAGAQVRVGVRSSVRLQLVDGREVALTSIKTYTLSDQNLENGELLSDVAIHFRKNAPLRIQ